MKLFMLSADTDDGDNMDALVWAKDKVEAIIYWRSYYGDLVNGLNPRCWHVTKADRPDGCQPGVLAWGTDMVVVP